jgi:hypothetical protein
MLVITVHEAPQAQHRILLSIHGHLARGYKRNGSRARGRHVELHSVALEQSGALRAFASDSDDGGG